MMAEIFWGACPSPLNAAMAMGNWVRPTPVTSTRNWASAGIAGVEARAASRVRREVRGTAASEEGERSRSIVIGIHQYLREDPGTCTGANVTHTGCVSM